MHSYSQGMDGQEEPGIGHKFGLAVSVALQAVRHLAQGQGQGNHPRLRLRHFQNLRRPRHRTLSHVQLLTRGRHGAGGRRVCLWVWMRTPAIRPPYPRLHLRHPRLRLLRHPRPHVKATGSDGYKPGV